MAAKEEEKEMNPKIDTDEIIREIRANTARLEGCVKPHDFSVDASPTKPMFKKWKCSKCGGVTDAINKIWYERGLKDFNLARIEDTAMLIRRLCREIAKHDAHNGIRAKALDYLHRHNLGGSPLKGEATENLTNGSEPPCKHAYQEDSTVCTICGE